MRANGKYPRAVWRRRRVVERDRPFCQLNGITAAPSKPAALLLQQPEIGLRIDGEVRTKVLPGRECEIAPGCQPRAAAFVWATLILGHHAPQGLSIGSDLPHRIGAFDKIRLCET